MWCCSFCFSRTAFSKLTSVLFSLYLVNLQVEAQGCPRPNLHHACACHANPTPDAPKPLASPHLELTNEVADPHQEEPVSVPAACLDDTERHGSGRLSPRYCLALIPCTLWFMCALGNASRKGIQFWSSNSSKATEMLQLNV